MVRKVRQAAGRLRLELVVRRREPLHYARMRYAAALRTAGDIGRRHGFPGGRLTDEGDFYLEVRGFLVHYNIRDRGLTWGDGQSLDVPTGRVSTPLERFVLESVPDDGVYLDVGANNGFFYALQVARLHPRAQVFAFEPDPQILLHLERNIAINELEEQITVVAAAVSDTVSEGRLTSGLGASGYLLDPQTSAGVPVPVLTLDGFAAERGLRRVDVIKIDVEGHEERVLRGAMKTLSERRPLIVLELTDDLLARSGGSRERIEQLLAELGYRLEAVDGSNDVVALPPGSTLRL